MAEEVVRLHWADYLVTFLSLVVALGIGVFFAFFKGGQKTKEEYLMGNRRMNLAPVCLSLFVSFQSAISLIGSPSDIYNTGTMQFFCGVGNCVSYVIAYFTIVPLIYPLRLTSVYEYLQLRFRSKGITLLITIIGMVQTSLYMGIALYTPALVLQAAAGLSLWVAVVLVGSVGTIYTAIGGIKSVVWTDVFQTIVMFTGILAILIKGFMRVGGFTEMANIASDGGRLIFDEVDLKARHSYWSTIIGQSFMHMVFHVNQASAQRICSLPTLRKAKRCFLLNIPVNLVYYFTLSLMGVLLYAYFVTIGCDPYAAGYIQNKNQVGPYFVMHVLRDLPGMTGLYMSMLFSGALSTVSSGINSLAANTVEDVLARPLRGVKDTTITLIAKFSVVGYGGLSLGVAYLFRNFSGPVTQIAVSVIGAFGSPVLGVYFLAAGFPRSNAYGAIGGIVVGSAISMTMALGTTLYGASTSSLPSGPVDQCTVTNTSWTQATVSAVTNVTLMANGAFNSTIPVSSGERATDFSIWDISYQWLSVIGFSATILSGVIITLIAGWKKDPETVDPKLIFPICRRLYKLPELESNTEGENLHGKVLLTLEEPAQEMDYEREEMDKTAFITNGVEQESA